MSEGSLPRTRLQIWFLAARPKTLPASITPVIIAGAMAIGDQVFHLPSFLAALCGGILLQIGSNFVNDLIDFQKAVDTAERIGPLRVTQAGLVTPRQMRNATIVVFALALVIGIYLVARAGLPIAVIGLVSIVCAVLYTAGPHPLGYIGLGELFVLIFFGMVPLAGTYYAMSLTVNAQVIAVGIAPGLLAVAILVVNNLRDIATDRKSGRRTLAVRFGRSFAQVEYIICVTLGITYPVLHYLIFRSHPSTLLGLFAVVAAIPLVMTILKSRDGVTLNNALAGTGRMLLLYGLLFSVGWLL
jgi:1,4-dihydroxy-2-naphthoate octaprenyltransferase